MSSPKHLIVCSAEGNFYCAWQAKVFVYSCLKRQGVAPVVMVHGKKRAEFEEIERAGARVVCLPNVKRVGARREWAARNAVVSLLASAEVARETGADFVVLMDPDMVWTEAVIWPDRFAVDDVLNASHLGLSGAIAKSEGIEAPVKGCRVPYVIPTDLVAKLASVWLYLLERFAESPAFAWDDQMCAFDLAVAAVGEEPLRLELSQTNALPHAEVTAPLLHYAHEYRRWSKQWFQRPRAGLWTPEKIPTKFVQGWIHREVTDARVFYESLKVTS